MNNIQKFFLQVLNLSLLELIGFVGLLIIIGFILGLIQKSSNKYLFSAFGYKGILATAWIGTPVHELGHALMCLAFRHQITDIRLFILHPTDNTLGYVKHSYSKQSIYQNVGNFFIGIGPIFSGIGSLFLSLYCLLPNSFKVFQISLNSEINTQSLNMIFLEKLVHANFNLIRSIFALSNLTNPYFWVFLIISIGISSHIALSGADIKGAGGGLAALFVIIIFITMIGYSISRNLTSYFSIVTKYYIYVLSFSMIALLFSSLTLAVSFTLFKLKKAITE